jgi:hypothetical protein
MIVPSDGIQFGPKSESRILPVFNFAAFSPLVVELDHRSGAFFFTVDQVI